MEVVTLVAVLCHLSSNPALPPLCREEIVADSDQSPSLNMTSCQVGGQAGVAEWMAANPKYRESWSLSEIKCVKGRYIVKNQA